MYSVKIYIHSVVTPHVSMTPNQQKTHYQGLPVILDEGILFTYICPQIVNV